MIKSVYFLPHGMQIIPDTEQEQLEEFRELHEKMLEFVKSPSSDTDYRIVITPHGYSLESDFVVYLHDTFKTQIFQLDDSSVVYGSVIDEQLIDGDKLFAENLLGKMTLNNIPTQGLVHGFSGYPLLLNWGTSVPLHYAHKRTPCKTVIISIPRSRHDHLLQLKKHLTNLATVLNGIDKSIEIIISGDLSHVHQDDGPYGYHESSTVFDEKVMYWMRLDQPDTIMKELLTMQPNALACGMAGIYLINEIHKLEPLKLEKSFYRAPTYFGMGIGVWKTNDSE